MGEKDCICISNSESRMHRFQPLAVVGVEPTGVLNKRAGSHCLGTKRTGEHTGCCHRGLKTSFEYLARSSYGHEAGFQVTNEKKATTFKTIRASFIDRWCASAHSIADSDMEISYHPGTPDFAALARCGLASIGFPEAFRTPCHQRHARGALITPAVPRRSEWPPCMDPFLPPVNPHSSAPATAPPKPEQAARTFCAPTNHLRERSLATTLRFNTHLSTVTRARVRGNLRYPRSLHVSNFVTKDRNVRL
jgi:hypothetical protein